jgi:DNA primase
VKLRRQGREYVGLSPFNKEKSPSFYVNDEKGFFHDFSSGKHGDLIAFLQETERLSFPEAVERLAAEAGLPLPTLDPRSAQVAAKRAGLSEWLELAARWFEAELGRPVGEAARLYLAGRGLPPDQWARFGVGYAPASRTGLKDYLIAKGAQPAELVEAGLLIAPEDGAAPYDRFRDRVIFPITDGRGRVVSFGGRALNPEARAKYLNGPETPLFHKSALLYGLYEARKLLHVGGEGADLFVVEGYLDVIACQRSGLAAVAPMGTALTEDQMDLLWRLHTEPTLCFDADGAGRRAAHRALERAIPMLKSGRSFKFAHLSGGKDPDDVLREQGPAGLKSQLAKTRPFVEELFLRERDSEPLLTPERRAGFKSRLRNAAGSIGDKDLADQYQRELFRRFDELFPRFTPRQLVGGRWTEKKSPEGLQNKLAGSLLRARSRRFNAAVAAAAVEFPAWLGPHIEEFSNLGFGDDRLKPLVDPILEILQEPRLVEDFTCSDVEDYIKRAGASGALTLARRIADEIPAPPFFDNRLPRETAQACWVSSFNVVIELAAVEIELENREFSGDEKSHFEGRRYLRSRQLALRQRISDMVDWNESAAAYLAEINAKSPFADPSSKRSQR